MLTGGGFSQASNCCCQGLTWGRGCGPCTGGGGATQLFCTWSSKDCGAWGGVVGRGCGPCIGPLGGMGAKAPEKRAARLLLAQSGLSALLFQTSQIPIDTADIAKVRHGRSICCS